MIKILFVRCRTSLNKILIYNLIIEIFKIAKVVTIVSRKSFGHRNRLQIIVLIVQVLNNATVKF